MSTTVDFKRRRPHKVGQVRDHPRPLEDHVHFGHGLLHRRLRSVHHRRRHASDQGRVASLAVERGPRHLDRAAGLGRGALLFGRVADMLGRKRIYGFEVLVLAAGAMASAFSPNIWWLIGFRIVLGIGIGGDYPVSSTIMSEFSGKTTPRDDGHAWSSPCRRPA